MFIKVSYTFLDSNSICHKCFAPVLTVGGGGGIQEKRKRNQHHNFGIKEPDISYLDATNEISLTMFSDFFPFPVNLAPLKFFFSLEPLSCFFLLPSFPFFSLSLSFFPFPFPFFWRPFRNPGGPRPPKPPKIRPYLN